CTKLMLFIMNTLLNRLNALRELLIQGVLVDLSHSIVVILVITALFSTPLILGSIKNRVYVAVKAQVEKENNAREITIQQADADVQHNLDNDFIQQLQKNYPDYQIVGNYKSVIMIEGPAGAQIQTLQTLIPDDPRTEALLIQPKVPTDFGLFDLIISDTLGELLYGEEWHTLWHSTQFAGGFLTLSINDKPLQGQFRIVARQTTAGRKIYASTELGLELKKYSIGLGSTALKLPVVEDQIQYSLPRFETMHCIVEFPNKQCDAAQQTQILKRLRAENFQVEETNKLLANINRFQVTLTKVDELEGRVKIQPTKGDCEARLSHHVQPCPSAAVIAKTALKTTLINQSMPSRTIQLAGITYQSYDLLPGIREMENQHGGRRLDFWEEGITDKGIEMVAPYDASIKLGKASLQLEDAIIPAFITAYYQCPEGKDCPFYTTPLAVYRLQNVAEGVATFEQGNQALFLPVNPRIDYDEVLFYGNQVEEVKPLFERLRDDLSGYNVSYNIYAINKLERQDKRLSTLFNLTVVLSVLFILLAVGALAKSNVDRRRRQMAQLFILGYSKLFVSLLLVCEYVLLTALASVTAIGVGSAVFAAARYFLQSALEQHRITEFTTIVNAMTLDIGAFMNVFLIVISLTTLVAGLAAYYASKSDPVELLD
ncbi:MAG TPA: ABC transporter permease, partial [Beggiatoa sp.]|nr:ABC transporter permease [Beggiatoa sp.]